MEDNRKLIDYQKYCEVNNYTYKKDHNLNEVILFM